ncbi:MAG: hypothetical protein RLZZ519_2209 [Bacteroidota bacterium]
MVYGVNGSGKTTILEALSIASSGFFLGMDPYFISEREGISKKDVRLVTPPEMLLPEFQYPSEIHSKGEVLGEPIQWTRRLGGPDEKYEDIDEKILMVSQKAISIAQNGTKGLLPIIAYLPVNRIYSQRKDTEISHPGRFLGYLSAVIDRSIQKYIRHWFRDSEYLLFQKRQSNPDYRDQGLEGIKNIVLGAYGLQWNQLFYHEPASFTNLPRGFYFKPSDASKSVLPESSLSDGQRNFFWLFLEIAWRCYMLNPYLGESAASETNGIVMIDEVDLHLHPEWQQKVLGMLTKAFPKIQFVVTTHSPIVLGSVKQGQVILLEGQTATVVERPYGLKPSYILEVLMKVNERLPELQAPIERYLNLINNGQGKSDQAIAIRSALEELLSPEDPLFVEADILLDFLTPATI